MGSGDMKAVLLTRHLKVTKKLLEVKHGMGRIYVDKKGGNVGYRNMFDAQVSPEVDVLWWHKDEKI